MTTHSTGQISPEHLRYQIAKRLVHSKINRKMTSGMAGMVAGCIIAIIVKTFPQEQNPYASTPEVQAYHWVQSSLDRIQQSQDYPTQLPIAPDNPNSSLSTIVQAYDTARSTMDDSLSTITQSLTAKKQTLESLSPVVQYHAFEADRDKVRNWFFYGGIIFTVLGAAYCMLNLNRLDNPNYRTKLEQRILATLPPQTTSA